MRRSQRTTSAAAFCLLLLLAPSCVESIDYSGTLEQKVVVNCILAPADDQVLRVTFNGETGSSRFEAPEEVDARLFCDGTEIGRFEKGVNDGEWRIGHRPVPGGRYSISVSVQGHGTVTAETTFPQSLPPVQRTSWNEGQERTFIQSSECGTYWMFVFQQPAEEWESLMRCPAATENDLLSQEIGSDHPGVDGFNSMSETVSVSGTNNGRTLRHYLYLRIAPEPAQYPLRFSVEWPGLENGLAYFRSVSDEYDRYLKTSLQKILAVQNEDDPTYWFDEGKVFSNISGGLGIFGAYDEFVIQFNYLTDLYFNSGIPYDEWPFNK